MSNNENIKIINANLPICVKITNTIFLFLSSSVMISISSFIIIFGSYFLDSYYSEIKWFPKGGSLLAIFGLLLTIKYRFLKDSKTFKDYFESVISAGNFTELTISVEEIKKVKYIAIIESVGFWFIIVGTLISVFGEYVPLINLCKK